MSFTNEEIANIQKEMIAYIDRNRPQPEIRDDVDIAYKIDKQSVEIFEIRKAMNGKKIENSIAKTTYDKKNKKWKIYWMRADLKWHNYKPKTEVGKLKAFIELVEEDEYGCFWG